MNEDDFRNFCHTEIVNITVKVFVDGEFKGTGFFVTPDGLVLTAFHCIGAYPPEIEVETQFGDKLIAELDNAKSLPKQDIAVLQTDHPVGNCIPLGLLSEVINGGDSVVAVGYPGGNINEKVGHYPSHISRFSGKQQIEIPNAIKGKGQSGGPIYHYKSKRIVGIAQAGYDHKVISDVGLAIRLDLLFQRWSELRYINDELVEVWDERLHDFQIRFCNQQPKIKKVEVESVVKKSTVAKKLNELPEIEPVIKNPTVAKKSNKLPLIIISFVVFGIGFYLGIDNKPTIAQTKPLYKSSEPIKPIKESISVTVPISKPKESIASDKTTTGYIDNQQSTYVTQLSFIDANTRSMIGNIEESMLINDAILSGIKRIHKFNPNIKFNSINHEIKNSDGNVNKLLDIIFHPGLTPNERVEKIISDMMEPAKVDVIVTGQYTDVQDKIHIKPLIIVKQQKKIVAKSLSFLKQDYICENKLDRNRKVLCSNTYEEIEQAVKDLLRQHDKISEPTYTQQDTYVTQLSFIDANTRSMIGNTEESMLINDAILSGIKQAHKFNPNIKFNAISHEIRNSDSNVNKLLDFIFHPGLTPNERVEKIISDMMDPAKVDVIVTGQYTDVKDKIHIKPLIIVKRQKKILAKSLSFLKQDYICKDLLDRTRKVLCSNTYVEIEQAVKELLESL